jgi:hypothetical protein
MQMPSRIKMMHSTKSQHRNEFITSSEILPLSVFEKSNDHSGDQLFERNGGHINSVVSTFSLLTEPGVHQRNFLTGFSYSVGGADTPAERERALSVFDHDRDGRLTVDVVKAILNRQCERLEEAGR